MSWQAYVTQLEDGPAKCKYAALVGCEGGSLGVWAESTSKECFALSPDDLAKLYSHVTNKEDTKVMTDGAKLNGAKFSFILRDDDSLVLQGKETHKDYSLVAACSGRVMVIGVNPTSEIKATGVRNEVEKMRDYLKGMGF